jgi:hypothetical protein
MASAYLLKILRVSDDSMVISEIIYGLCNAKRKEMEILRKLDKDLFYTEIGNA